MKKILTYMTLMAAVLLTACSDADDFAQGNKTVVVPSEIGKIEATTGSIPDFMYEEGELTSRSSLAYDHFNARMKFSWKQPKSGGADAIGVFALNDNPTVSAQMKYVVTDDDLVESGNYVTGVFENAEPAAAPLDKEYEYEACSPWKDGYDKDYTQVPISYLEQKQASNVQMKLLKEYNDGGKTDEGKKADYMASEAAACAHLGAYDFMASTATTTIAAHAHFLFQHMGATVRFFMLAPSNDVIYDSLQLVNNYKKFPVRAKMNVKEKTLTPVEERHVLSLEFNGGIDMSDADKRATYMYTYSKPMIVAYMEVPAIDLTFEDANKKSQLYLLAHRIDTTDPENPKTIKYCYKANLSQKNIRAGYYYQWNVGPSTDSPITFDEISIETWKTGTEFTNTDGDGTDDW